MKLRAPLFALLLVFTGRACSVTQPPLVPPPSPPCLDVAQQYCNIASINGCPHNSTTWWAVHSGGVDGGARSQLLWRCYSPSCLNLDHTAYLQGSGCSQYCTRDHEIKQILSTCKLPPAPSPPPSPPPPPSPTPPPPLPTIRNLWPLPQEHVELSGSPVVLAPADLFAFRYLGQPARTSDTVGDGDGPSAAASGVDNAADAVEGAVDTPAVLTAAFARYTAILMKMQAAAVHDVGGGGNQDQNQDGGSNELVLSSLEVYVESVR